MPNHPARLLAAIIACAAPLAAQGIAELARIHLPASVIRCRWFPADVDGDGFTDVLQLAGYEHHLLANRGDAVFSDVPLPLTTTRGRAAAWGDFDRDGDLDLFVGSDSLAPGQLLRNDGNFTFTDVSARTPLGTFVVQDVVAFDAEGDGDLDLYLSIGNGTGGPEDDRFWRNDGTGRFVDDTAPSLGVFTTSCHRVHAADLDGDRDVDLLLEGIDGVWLAVNQGMGTFAYSRVAPGAVYSIAVGDLDRDGDVDLVISRSYGVRLEVWTNDGSGTFTDASTALAPAYPLSIRFLRLHDLDGDGDLDLVVAPEWAPRTIFWNDGSGALRGAGPVFANEASPAGDIAAADFDNDGFVDLLCSGTHRRGMHFGGPAGTFTSANPEAFPPLDYATALAFADFDGDGDLDLLWMGGGTGNVQAPAVLLNDGFGAVEAVLPLLPAAANLNTVDVAVGDVDGDGDIDVVLGARGSYPWGQPNQLLRNDGQGNFAISPLPGPAQFTYRVLLFDADGDGDLDLVESNAGYNLLSSNDGLGNFSIATAWLFQTGELPVSAGDVDGDGDLDLLAMGAQRVRVWENHGAGFIAGSTLVGSFDDIALSDLDGDGRLDLVTSGNTVEWFRNPGNGDFAQATPQSLPGGRPRSRLIIGDLDADGDADVVVAFASFTFLPGQPVGTWFRNDRGAFTALDLAAERFAPPFAVGDVDGDGDMDVMSGGLDNQPLWNLDRHLQVLERGRIGRSVVIRISRRPGALQGAAFAVPLIASGPGAQRFHVPGVGSTPLDPNATWIGPALPVPAPAGRLDVPMSIPRMSSLIGVTAWLQAVVLGPGTEAAFTNVWRETIAH